MRIGVVKEIKTAERRVALTPAGAQALTTAGHEVLIERGAGSGSGFPDLAYGAAGAWLIDHAADVWSDSELLLKVKEPIGLEYGLLHDQLTLFTYLHLAPNRALTDALVRSGTTAIAYETVEDARGGLPLLAPMSEIAGRLATQAGAYFLQAPLGGPGVLIGGVPGVAPARVAVLGGGVVGTHAARIAVGMEAEVTILERSLDRLRALDELFGRQARILMSDASTLEAALREADILIGRARPGRPYAEAGDPRDADAHAARIGDRRCRDRPGRVLRDLPADDSRRPGLRGRGHHALLRGEHAGRGPGHRDSCADQCHLPVRPRARRSRRRGGARLGRRGRSRSQHPRRRDHPSASGRGLRVHGCCCSLTLDRPYSFFRGQCPDERVSTKQHNTRG